MLSPHQLRGIFCRHISFQRHLCSGAVCLSLLRGLWQQLVGHRRLYFLLQSPGTSSDLLPLALASSKVGVPGVKVQPQPFFTRGPKDISCSGFASVLAQISKKKDQSSEKKLVRRGGLALLSVHTVCHPCSVLSFTIPAGSGEAFRGANFPGLLPVHKLALGR